jgi:UPF0755 protein
MEYISKIIFFAKEFIKVHIICTLISVFLFITLILFAFFANGPSDVKTEHNVNISSGLSLMQISLVLERNNIIRSKDMFRVVVILFGGENSIKAGPYLFDGTDNVFKVAIRILKADYGVPVKKITIIEGMRSRDMLNLFGSEFSNLDKVELEKELLSNEGYLFPDTYFFPLTSSSGDIIKMLSDNFSRHILDLDLDKSKTSKDLKEIITMASIIEGEAKEDKDRKIVADILWRRLEIGMLLQVDTTFMYINGKPSSEITKADLKIDSPYNTYVNKGLPPTPISNPGMEAINSVMFPTPNEYLYYLSDKDGLMHYSVTFEEHKKNKEKYLK